MEGLNMDMDNPDPKTRQALDIDEKILALGLSAFLKEENLQQKRQKKAE